MSDKSYVTMAQHICPICGQVHETGELLLDKRLREVFDRHTITGWGMCPKCHEKVDEGYVAFVELAQEPNEDHNSIQPTGRYAWLRRSILPELLGERAETVQEMSFVDAGFMNALVNLYEKCVAQE